MLMASSAASATAHMGKRAFGAATFTSNTAGPLCRCRSFSDFFRASSMKDMSAAMHRGGIEQRRGAFVFVRPCAVPLQHHKIAEPVTRELAYAHFALRAAEIDLRA